MNKQFNGSSLVFLVSQPRSGSTLLQRLLSGHHDIYSVPEPWLMFPPIYAVREVGHHAEYDSSLCAKAIDDFIKTLPCGKETYINGLRLGYGSIYHEALLRSEKKLFLDKTPRYYEILSELVEIFPDAKVIILVRNPLGVLNSILKTWVKKNWVNLVFYKRDLLTAPRLMMRFIENRSDNVYLLRYEELVQTPEKVLPDLCHFLSIEYTDDLLTYSNSGHVQGEFGDKSSVTRFNKPITGLSEKWKEELHGCQEKHFALEYIKELGPELLKKMGYCYDELIVVIGEAKIKTGVVPWADIMKSDGSLKAKIITRYHQLCLQSRLTRFIIVSGFPIILLLSKILDFFLGENSKKVD